MESSSALCNSMELWVVTPASGRRSFAGVAGREDDTPEVPVAVEISC